MDIAPIFLPLREWALVIKILRKARQQQQCEIERIEGLSRIRFLSNQEVSTLDILKSEQENLERAIKILWGVDHAKEEHESVFEWGGDRL